MTGREQHWLDEALPSELRRVLENAHDASSERAQVARLRGRLAATIGPAFGAPHAMAEPATVGATAGSRAAHPLFVTKLVAPVCLFALGFVATWWGVGGSTARPTLQPIAAVQLAPAAPVPQLLESAQEAVPAPQLPDSAQEAKPELAPPSAANKPTPKARRGADRELGLSEELRQLETIRAAVERSPQRALALADAHQRRFAHGALGPERELLRIDAWLRLGEYERARQRAEQLLAQPSAHPYRAQIARLLADYRVTNAQRGAP